MLNGWKTVVQSLLDSHRTAAEKSAEKIIIFHRAKSALHVTPVTVLDIARSNRPEWNFVPFAVLLILGQDITGAVLIWNPSHSAEQCLKL